METTNEKHTVNESITDKDDKEDKLENRIETLLAENMMLKNERQKCQEEFGAQRGKMKELFLQKEEEHIKLQKEIERLRLELDEARSQLTVTGLDLEANQAERIKSEDELTSLQQFVSETLEESSRYEEEIHSLKQRIGDLERELNIHRGSMGTGTPTVYTDTAHSPVGGDGGMLNLTKPGTVLTSLARLPAKLVSQLGATDQPFHHHHHHHQQQIDDTGMKKASEESEMLRSLIKPLEEEISVLKAKLRETDEKLQRYQNQEEKMKEAIADKRTAKLIDLSQSSGESQSESLQNVLNDDVNITISSSTTANLMNNSDQPQSLTSVTMMTSDNQATTAVVTSPTTATSISGANTITTNNNISTAKSLVCDMCVNYEAQLVGAQEKCTELERKVTLFERYKDELAKETILNKQLESKWQESRDQHKNEVSELQEKMLLNEEAFKLLKQTYMKSVEEIKTKFNKISEERRIVNEKLERIQTENENLVGKYNAHSDKLTNEAIDLPDSVERLQEMWLRQRDELIKARIGQERADETVKTLECLCGDAQRKQEELQMACEHLDNEVKRLNQLLCEEETALKQSEKANENLTQQLESLNKHVYALKQAKKKLETSECELRTRLISLQTGLENGEAVQKDFVLLSQNLQKELERLRDQDSTLRWEHEEDVTECRGCGLQFKSASKRKLNCRHCGRIFCLQCLNHKITSGPAQRESRVCQVCHTLLNSQTAPYFSTTSAVHPTYHQHDNK